MSLIKRLIKCLSRLGIMGWDKICVNRNRSISNYFCCYISFEQNNRSLLYRIKIKTVKNLKFFNYTTILGLWKLFLNVSVFCEAYLKKWIDGLMKMASYSTSHALVNQQIILMLKVLTGNFVMNVCLSIGFYPWMTLG